MGLTHGSEGGVFVESSRAVVALRARKPLSKWSVGGVVEVVLFWRGRIRAAGVYTSVTDATRLISEVEAMLLIFSISDDVGVTWLPPTCQYCQLCHEVAALGTFSRGHVGPGDAINHGIEMTSWHLGPGLTGT